MKKYLLPSLIAGILLITLGVILTIPFCRYGIVGLVRGESFYQRKPTSYWRGVVKKCHFAPPPPPPTLLDKVHAFLEKQFLRKYEVPPIELDALPVFIELLGDEDADVRWYAVMTIGCMGPQAKNEVVLSALHEALNDPDEHVRVEVAKALERLAVRN